MNKIQIYGLPRTGTNYVEFLIKNNLDNNYKSMHSKVQKPKNVEDSYIKTSFIATKHCKPNIELGENFIIVLKESGNFISSFKKWRRFSENEIIDIYLRGIADYIKFFNKFESKVIIVFHEDILGNEEKFIDLVSKKFNIDKLSNEIITTDLIMNRSGGCGTTDKKYNLNNKSEIDLGDLYNQIKELKIKL